MRRVKRLKRENDDAIATQWLISDRTYSHLCGKQCMLRRVEEQRRVALLPDGIPMRLDL